jgi:hypothetical protein
MLLFLIKNTSIERFRAARRQGENMGNAMVALKTADEVKAVSAELAKNTKDEPVSLPLGDAI